MTELTTLENTLEVFMNGVRDVGSTTLFVCFIVVIGALFKHWDEAKDIWNWFKNRREQREEERKITFENQKNILLLQESFNDLKQEQNKMDKENLEHWEVSKSIRNDFSSDIFEIKNGIVNIATKMNEIEETRLKEEEKRKATKRSELKERIGSLYRYYHEKKEWNYMEEEALRDLIKQYESNGGLNSFVHDKVEPESYTWKLVTKEMLDVEESSNN